jgi:hypothetical protein
LVLVAVEEPFDWDQIPPAGHVDVMDFGRLPEFHGGLRQRGLRPTYALDYIAADGVGAEFLGWLERDEALLGAHLHPWVNPPFGTPAEEHSFAPNLPGGLEQEKMTSLVERIRARCGRSPLLYQAGRYGIGARTVASLPGLGLCVDASLSPGFDYRSSGGPDFRRFDSAPRWYRGGQVLSVPVTGGYLGALGAYGAQLQGLAEAPLARALRLPACLDRLGLYGRLRLSPEGNSLLDLQRLTLALLRRGERLFTLYLHSSSLVAGATGYAKDAAGVSAMLARSWAYVDWFRDALGGQFRDHREVWEWAQAGRPTSTTENSGADTKSVPSEFVARRRASQQL